jgi:hypothetical protein
MARVVLIEQHPNTNPAVGIALQDAGRLRIGELEHRHVEAVAGHSTCASRWVPCRRKIGSHLESTLAP